MTVLEHVSTGSPAPGRVNLLAPEVVADPYGFFASHREKDPIFWNESLQAWVVTSYDLVRGCFRDPALSADRITPYYRSRLTGPDAELHRPNYEMMSRWMVFVDAPEHTRLRRLIDRAFRPRAVERLVPEVEGMVEGLLDQVQDRPGWDFLSDFAFPLPVLVICRMFGVPQEDTGLIKGWSDDILTLVFGALDVSDRHARARRAFLELSDYLEVIIEERRKNPGEDLISMLLGKQQGESLSDQEIISVCVLALFGGHETTTNLLANGLRALLTHRSQWERLVADPSLLPGAIEELLRFDGPSKAMWRIAAEDHEVGGRAIEKGARVLLVQAAANRDPAVFTRPDDLDISRDNASAHITFGYAAHYCIGAPFARMEARVGFGALLKRMPDLALSETPHRWYPALLNRALLSLPVQRG